MRVEDSSADGGDRPRPDDSHVPREGDQVDPGRGEGLRDRLVRAPGHEGRLDPLLFRPIERRAGPVGEDKRETRAKLDPDRGGRERPEVAPRARDPDRQKRPRRGAHAPASRPTSTYRPPSSATGATVPITIAPGSAATANSTASRPTITPIPTPPLNVARSSGSPIPPSAPNSRMTDGIGHRSGCTRAPRTLGHPRGVLPGSPP